jgi:hypothetical protein
MSTQPLFLVFCESELNGVGLVQYVRADTPESALVLAKSSGVTPIKAERFAEAQDWMLDAMNRSQRGVAAVHDGLRATRQAAILQSPMWTIFCAVSLTMLFWGLVSGLLSFCAHLR